MQEKTKTKQQNMKKTDEHSSPSQHGGKGVTATLNPAQVTAMPVWSLQNAYLWLQRSPQHRPIDRNDPTMSYPKAFPIFNTTVSEKKTKNMWMVINEQGWLTAGLLTWSNIMLALKLSLQKIITEWSISTQSLQMLPLLLLVVLLLLLLMCKTGHQTQLLLYFYTF